MDGQGLKAREQSQRHSGNGTRAKVRRHMGKHIALRVRVHWKGHIGKGTVETEHEQ